MKKLLLFVIACTLGLFTVNAQDNRLESIIQTNEGNNITYVYEEGTNKVVEIIAGVNLPMLIKIAALRKEKNLKETVEGAQEAGKKYINIASQLLGM